MVKNLPAMEATWVQSLHWEDSLEKEMAVFLPGKSHGERSLAGYRPWGHKESDMTEQLNTAHTCVYIYIHTHHIFFIHSSIDGHFH